MKQKSAVNGFFAEMLGQHIVNHSAVLVALGFAISLDRLVKGFRQFRAIRQSQLLDQEVVFDRFQFRVLA